eukprot:gb/GECG01016048.1/.p1 GENE.gb/GECG01016048.1/~~gb/GECG01016048.1/.p1  ORF type:complete len:1508 (+),score=247.81 gb/GECG01016048.1/:1-4524(+)
MEDTQGRVSSSREERPEEHDSSSLLDASITTEPEASDLDISMEEAQGPVRRRKAAVVSERSTSSVQTAVEGASLTTSLGPSSAIMTATTVSDSSGSSTETAAVMATGSHQTQVSTFSKATCLTATDTSAESIEATNEATRSVSETDSHTLTTTMSTTATSSTGASATVSDMETLSSAVTVAASTASSERSVQGVAATPQLDSSKISQTSNWSARETTASGTENYTRSVTSSSTLPASMVNIPRLPPSVTSSDESSVEGDDAGSHVDSTTAPVPSTNEHVEEPAQTNSAEAEQEFSEEYQGGPKISSEVPDEYSQRGRVTENEYVTRIQALARRWFVRKEYGSEVRAALKNLRENRRAEARRKARQRNIAFNQRQLLLYRETPSYLFEDVEHFQKERSARKIQHLYRLKGKGILASRGESVRMSASFGHSASDYKASYVSRKAEVDELLRAVDALIMGEKIGERLELERGADNIDIDPMRLADMQNEMLHHAQSEERNWYLQKITEQPSERSGSPTSSTRNPHVVTGVSLKHQRIQELRRHLKQLLRESFKDGFGSSHVHLYRRSTVLSSHKLLRRLANLPDLETAANLLREKSKELEKEKPSYDGETPADLCFPLAGTDEELEVAQQQHEATLGATDPRKPWWKFHGWESPIDMRSVKAGTPWSDWLGDLDTLAEKGVRLEGADGSDSSSASRRRRHLARNFEDRILLTSEERDTEKGVYDELQASHLWMSYVADTIPSGFLFGSKTQQTENAKRTGLQQQFDEADNIKEEARCCRERVLKTIPSLAGITSSASSSAINEDPLHVEQVASTMKRLGVMDPWFTSSKGKQQVDDAKQRAAEATQKAEETVQDEKPQDAADEYDQRPETDPVEEGTDVSALLHEQIEMTVSLMENPAILGEYVEGEEMEDSAWYPYCSLGSAGKSLSERIKNAEKAIEKASTYKRERRQWGPLDKQVAARKIQRAYKLSTLRHYAREQLKQMEKQKAEQDRQVREERFEQVYSQLNNLLRQMVAEATGVEVSPQDLQTLKQQVDATQREKNSTAGTDSALRGQGARRRAAHHHPRPPQHTRSSAETLGNQPKVSEEQIPQSHISIIPRFRQSFETHSTNTTVRSSLNNQTLEASDDSAVPSIEDSTAATIKSSFGDYATPSRNRMEMPEYFDAKAVDRRRYGYFSGDDTSSCASATQSNVISDTHGAGRERSALGTYADRNTAVMTSQKRQQKDQQEPESQELPTFSEQVETDLDASDSNELSSTFDVSAPSDEDLGISLTMVGQKSSTHQPQQVGPSTEELPSTSHLFVTSEALQTQQGSTKVNRPDNLYPTYSSSASSGYRPPQRGTTPTVQASTSQFVGELTSPAWAFTARYENSTPTYSRWNDPSQVPGAVANTSNSHPSGQLRSEHRTRREPEQPHPSESRSHGQGPYFPGIESGRRNPSAPDWSRVDQALYSRASGSVRNETRPPPSEFSQYGYQAVRSHHTPNPPRSQHFSTNTATAAEHGRAQMPRSGPYF